MGLFGKRRNESSAETVAKEPRVVSPSYKIVLQRGVQEQLDAVDRAAFPDVHAAIGALGVQPWPAGERGGGPVDGPYTAHVAGYQITWTVGGAMRTVLVGAIFKATD